MGAWGIGTFDNDDAADWAYELEEAADLTPARFWLAGPCRAALCKVALSRSYWRRSTLTRSFTTTPASFQSLGVGFITACPDPDLTGPRTARLSDMNLDGRNDLCTQSGYQNRPGIDGNREYHARMNSTMPGGQIVLFCHDPDSDGCLDERVLSVSVIVWLP